MPKTIESDTLLVGIARADITPPIGIKSAGFAVRGPLTCLHDPLLATALVFSDGTQKVAVVSCDLLHLDAETIGEIRQQVRQKTNIPDHAITIACTHTHYGPDPYRDLDDPKVAAYRANLIHTLTGIIEVAATNLQAVKLRVQWGASDIGINRREKRPDGRVILGQNPDGPIDRAVGILQIEAIDEDKDNSTPLACMINFQTHPVSQTGQVAHISADYPGKMREVVEALTGAQCLYLQGASGNINAVRMEPRYEPARSLGMRLGCEVVRLWEICKSPTTHDLSTASGIRATSRIINLPRTRYGSQENAADLVTSLEQEITELKATGGKASRIAWAQTRLSRAKEALESWKTGIPQEPVKAEVQAWCVGELAIVTAPGEIFNQIGVQVKAESPFAHTFFVAHANGSIGYVPVPKAYTDGGYEVTHASQVTAEAAGILTTACLDLLHMLKTKEKP